MVAVQIRVPEELWKKFQTMLINMMSAEIQL